jgi:hypothetical protein
LKSRKTGEGIGMAMKIHSFFMTALLLLLGEVSVFSQSPAFTAASTKTTLGVNEQFQVSFTVNADGKKFEPPVFKDFHVLSGPNQSTSMEFVNGNVSQSVSYGYILQARSEGVFKIGPASIEVNGRPLKSNVLTITVTKGSGASAKGNPEEQSVESQISENLYIKALVNKTNILRGEGINVTYKLFSKLDLVNFNLTKMPTLNGFWSQDADGSKKLELKKEVIDGIQYYTAEIKKSVLFPQREGTLVLDPMEAQTVVRVRTKRKLRGYDPFEDFFNDPFFGGSFQDYNYVAKSDPVKITVKPLPGNAPEGFSGAVGNFAMESFIDKPETKANDPVTLKIKVIGVGNIKLIEPLKLQLPADIETYDPKITDNISINHNGVGGSRSFEYLLIPRHAGEYKIKPFEFSFYSLEKKKYITLLSPEFALKVFKGNESETSSSGQRGVNQEDIQLLGKDIRYIKTGKVTFRNTGDHMFGTVVFYGMLAAPLAFVFAFVFWRKKNQQDNSNVTLVKSRKATKVAKKRLALANKYLKEHKNDQVYEEVLKSLYGYVADKFSIPVAALSKENIEAILLSNGKDKALVQKFLEVTNKCEFARYAPGGFAAADEIYQSSIHIIEQLEES